MNEFNGFHINTNIKVRTKKPLWKILLRSPYIRVAVVLLLIATVVIAFLAIVPLKTIKYKKTCVAASTDGNKIVSHYDDKGRLQKEEGFFGEELMNNTNYHYDKKGRLIKIEKFRLDHLDQVENYIYKNSLLSEKQCYLADGSLMGRTVYTYTDGVLQLHSEFDGEGNILSEQKYIYDKKRLVQTVNVDILSEHTVTTDMFYENGNIVKEKRIDSEKGESSIRYTFDNMGNLLSKTEKTNVYTLYSYTFKNRKVSVFY